MPGTTRRPRTGTAADNFTDEERAAMKERAKEVRAAKRGAAKDEDAQAVQAKIAELDGTDRELAEKVHDIVTSAAPHLDPKPWYGMPAYYKDGKVLCFFQPATKFKSRYATFGFDAAAALDDGRMWPTAFALTGMTVAVEKQLRALVQKAAG